MTYYSQSGQDKWVHELIGDKGIFVDIGAYDGINTSNSYALELVGWKGICVEANPDFFKTLEENRPHTICWNRAITNHKGKVYFGHDRIAGEGREVKCDTLQNILSYSMLPNVIDYLSADIEGHELIMLQSFDFTRYKFKAITIEHNIYCEGAERKNAMYEILSRNGYIRVIEDAKCLDPNPIYINQPHEDWYVHKDFYNH